MDGSKNASLASPTASRLSTKPASGDLECARSSSGNCCQPLPCNLRRLTRSNRFTAPRTLSRTPGPSCISPILLTSRTMPPSVLRASPAFSAMRTRRTVSICHADSGSFRPRWARVRSVELLFLCSGHGEILSGREGRERREYRWSVNCAKGESRASSSRW